MNIIYIYSLTPGSMSGEEKDIGNPLRYLLDSVKRSLHQNKIRV